VQAYQNSYSGFDLACPISRKRQCIWYWSIPFSVKTSLIKLFEHRIWMALLFVLKYLTPASSYAYELWRHLKNSANQEALGHFQRIAWNDKGIFKQWRKHCSGTVRRIMREISVSLNAIKKFRLYLLMIRYKKHFYVKGQHCWIFQENGIRQRWSVI